MTARIAAFAPLVLSVGLAGCSIQAPQPRRADTDRLPRVETVAPEYLAREETVELLATVEAMERSRLCAQVQGEVKGLTADIDIGRVIRKDEPLMTLDIPAIRAEQESARAKLAQAKNALEQAKETRKVAEQEVEEAKSIADRFKADLTFRELALKRVRELAKGGAVQPQLREEADLQRNSAKASFEASKVTILSKQARLLAAEAELRVAKSRIAVAEADLKLLDTRVELATIRAPYDGIIVRRWVHNGVVVRDPTMPLLTVIRTDMVRVVMDVPERYVPYIRAAQAWSPGKGPNRVRMKIQEYAGEQGVTRLASAVDPVTRQMRAEIHVKNDQEFRLRPGMTGTATVVLTEGKKRLTVPSTALVRVGDEVRIYHVAGLTQDDPPQGKVKSSVVSVGLDDGKTVEVRTGLTGSELVIAKGNGVVREGETVVAVKAREQK
jgi:RND family efflux transporter MFP subunit